MSNMSYCRFQNTARDLDDCADAIEGLMCSEQEPLSDEELRAAKRLVESCARIVQLLADEMPLKGEDAPDRDRFERMVPATLDSINEHAKSQP